MHLPNAKVDDQVQVPRKRWVEVVSEAEVLKYKLIITAYLELQD